MTNILKAQLIVHNLFQKRLGKAEAIEIGVHENFGNFNLSATDLTDILEELQSTERLKFYTDNEEEQHIITLDVEKCLDFLIETTMSLNEKFKNKGQPQIANEQDIINMQAETKHLSYYNRLTITKQIYKLQTQLNSILQSVEQAKDTGLETRIKEICAPLEVFLNDIQAVNKNYIQIYATLLDPITKEGEASRRHTITWTIISILVGFLLSQCSVYFHENQVTIFQHQENKKTQNDTNLPSTKKANIE